MKWPISRGFIALGGRARLSFREGLARSDDEAASDPIGEPRRDFTLDTRSLVVAERARDFAGVAQTHTSSQGVEERKGRASQSAVNDRQLAPIQHEPGGARLGKRQRHARVTGGK